MYKLAILLTLIGSLWASLTETSVINKSIIQLQENEEKRQYPSALRKIDSLTMIYKDSSLLLFIHKAHILYLQKKYKEAGDIYLFVAKTKDTAISSSAILQKGLTHFKRKENELALNCFIEALRINPQNEKARHNYELLYLHIAAKQKSKDNKSASQNRTNLEPQEEGYEDQSDVQDREEKGSEESSYSTNTQATASGGDISSLLKILEAQEKQQSKQGYLERGKPATGKDW
jgi:tetratricopeptide (TPR) repeat protein